MRVRFLVALTIALALGIQAQAATISLSPTSTADIAKGIYQGYDWETAHFGSSSDQYVMFNPAVDDQLAADSLGLLQFDVSSIPGGSTIISGRLTLFQEYNPQLGAVYSIFANTGGWSEPLNYTMRPATEAGAAASIVLDGGTNLFRTWDITALVSDWYFGSKTNYGVTLARTGGPFDYWTFFRGNGSSLNRPVLEVEYGTGAPVPEPGSSALIGLGLASLMGYRYRARQR